MYIHVLGVCIYEISNFLCIIYFDLCMCRLRADNVSFVDTDKMRGCLASSWVGRLTITLSSMAILVPHLFINIKACNRMSDT